MSQQYYTLVTNIGAARIAKATALGTVVNLSQMAVGDGGGNPITPSATATALTREVYRASLNMLEVDENNQKQVIAELLIPEEEGDFTIREVGLFDNNNNLIAIGSIADSYKPRLSSGTASQQIIRMVIQIDNTDAVGLKVDPAVVLATREFVEQTVNKKFGNVAYSVQSIAALREFNKPNATVVIVENYHDGINGGGGVFVKKDSQESDNGGTIIAAENGTRWARMYETLNPLMFGALGNETTDDTAAFEKLEAAIRHRQVDLQQRIYKTTKSFNKNRYTNGIFRTAKNQDYATGTVNAAQSLLGNGAGRLLGMVKTVPDQRSGRAARSILQGAAQDPRTGEFWTVQPYSDVSDGAGGTVEASVLVKYAPELWGDAKEIEPVLTSKPSADIGHQTVAVQYQNGQRYLWATGGNIKKNKRQLYAVRLQIADDTGEISDTTYYQLFADGVFNGEGNNCLSISPDCQWLACTSKYTESNMWVCRIWRINDLATGNNTDNWMYEFPLRSHNLPVQAIALDGNFVYVLHGGDATKANVYSVFAIDGTHIADHIGDDTGKDKMAELEKKGYNKYYESEAFVVCNFGGKLVLTQWISLGKKNNHHTCAVYAMRPLDRTVETGPVTYLADAANVDKQFRVNANFDNGGKLLFATGLDGNSFARVFNRNEYIGLTVVNKDEEGGEKRRDFAVLTHNVDNTGEGAITFYSSKDSGGEEFSENAGILRLACSKAESYLDIGKSAVYPSHTNKASLGKANKLWTNVYAATAAINTSDRRLKQDIGAIPDEVINAWRKVDLIQYRWKDAVAEKSAGARYHTGLIAQSISEAFAKHGLDAQDYGLLCYDQWPEVPAREALIDDNGNVIEEAVPYQPAGERWGIRAEECLFIEAESNRRAIAELMKRIDKLEKTKKA